MQEDLAKPLSSHSSYIMIVVGGISTSNYLTTLAGSRQLVVNPTTVELCTVGGFLDRELMLQTSEDLPGIYYDGTGNAISSINSFLEDRFYVRRNHSRAIWLSRPRVVAAITSRVIYAKDLLQCYCFGSGKSGA